ncbi:MAG: V-type ATPase subunit [bacterium]
MTKADTPYLIGVIREWERGFLEDDEYTRLIEAKSIEEARHVLVDTPYGERPMEEHLQEVHKWLGGGVNDERVYQFISARYDALNVATALMEKRGGNEAMKEKSPLGSLSADIIQSTVWHNLGWENVPEIWESFIKGQLEVEAGLADIMAAAASRAQTWRKQLAFTPLMREVAAWYDKGERQDKRERPFTPQDDATEYDRQMDEELIKIIKQHRFEPTGYDMIMAFWYAKELEVRNLRLLLAAKGSAMDSADLRKLNRSLFRSLA